MKVLRYMVVAFFLLIIISGCKELEAYDRHYMDPMGEDVRLASDMQKLECPPCIGPDMMDGQKQARITDSYRKSNAKGLPCKTSTTSKDALKVTSK